MFVLIGAGGHSKVVKDILIAGGHRVLGFLDDNRSETSFCGLPVLGKIKDLPTLIDSEDSLSFIITIGDNKKRKHMADELNQYPIRFGTAVHPQSFIGDNVHIGEGSVIMPFAVINADTFIGSHCIINSHAVVEHDCIVDSFVHLSPQSTLTGSVKAGEGVHFGASSCIIPGKQVGCWSIIGAGSTVIRDIPAFSTAVGSPAKIIKALEDGRT
ncbi:acetyltransferase [Falsibacillus pallidus]|uniref:Acetyltransferase EpsM n=1 Tax=Falsibacillus pallidus TaxID=493781 RepID=A0A370H0Z7_9BACI|nr:acetyltransferase [Falsibacillus pallidus]RDI47723.1 acetyltransferase EpsM [Falsibacillus pallidus]